jgi:hypothetical protein
VQQPTARWNPARSVWETDEAHICGHSAAWSEIFPSSGMTRSGSVYARPTWGPPMDDSAYSSSPGLLPTPRVSDTNGSGEHGTGGPDLRTAVERLFPTPCAQEPGGTLEQYRERLRRHDGRESTFTPLSMLVLELFSGESSNQPSDAGSASSDAPPLTP